MIKKQEWAEEVGVKYKEASKVEAVVMPLSNDVVEKGTDLVYILEIRSDEAITIIGDIASKIKILDSTEKELEVQPQVLVEELPDNTTISKQYNVTIKTDLLENGFYAVKLEPGIGKNTNNLENTEFITSNKFEITDTVPP